MTAGGWSDRLPQHRPVQSLSVGGHRLAFVTAGAGRPVVLLHGLGGSWQWWQRNLPALAAHYQVLALDLSQRQPWADGRRRLRSAEAAPVLTAWLDALDLKRVHLIGHSLGGLMAIRLAALSPAVVDRLILIDSAGLPFGRPLWQLALRAVGPLPERSAEFRRLVLSSNWRTNPLVVWQAAREMINDDVSDLAGRLQAPTLIVWGERDPMVPVRNAYRLHQLIAGSRLLVVPGAGHNPMYYHAGLVNQAILAFLAGDAQPLN